MTDILCPHCQSKNSLSARLAIYYGNVPLFAGGFDPDDGIVIETEILEIECRTCERTVELEVYFTQCD